MKRPRHLQRYGLEFLTVFLGVSLSLLAENWRQRRSDATGQTDSLMRLYTDLSLEEQDMAINANRAQTGVRAARWLVANGARGHSPDSVTAALTGMTSCSFLIPYMTEYTALKSSGRLSLIRNDTIRQNIVEYYEQEPFLEWLHERDCLLTGELVDGLVGQLKFVESRRERYPEIEFTPGRESIVEAPIFHDRVVRLTTQRSYMAQQVQQRISTSAAIRAQIAAELRMDSTQLLRERRRGPRFRPDSAGVRGDSTRFGRGGPDSLRRPGRGRAVVPFSQPTPAESAQAARGRGRRGPQ